MAGSFASNQPEEPIVLEAQEENPPSEAPKGNKEEVAATEDKSSSSSISSSEEEEEEVRKKEHNGDGEQELEDLRKLVAEEEAAFQAAHGGLTFKELASFRVTFLYNYSMVHHFGALTKLKWFTQIDENVILGALPTRKVIAKLVRQHQVKVTINCCCEFAGKKRRYQRLGVEEFQLKSPDFGTPTAKAIAVAIKIIERAIAEGKVVYVHCKAGKGRSASVVLCWLMHQYKLTPAEAQKRLSSLRPQVDRDLDTRAEVLKFYEASKASLETK